MGDRAYRTKLAAYFDYLVSGRYRRDYDSFPTILVVAANNAAEERIARAARVVGVGRPTPLPLLLTSWWRVIHPLKPPGLLAPIWREPQQEFGNRRAWLHTSEET
jgi:hypothetical protein